VGNGDELVFAVLVRHELGVEWGGDRLGVELNANELGERVTSFFEPVGVDAERARVEVAD
jgi:hypothetical protein